MIEVTMLSLLRPTPIDFSGPMRTGTVSADSRLIVSSMSLKGGGGMLAGSTVGGAEGASARCHGCSDTVPRVAEAAAAAACRGVAAAGGSAV